ncbi:MAG: hypothetical protein K6U74_01135, partial [Firmicutes bacterium]|nr:hypothetical protein [Bacillota bacterium]
AGAPAPGARAPAAPPPPATSPAPNPEPPQPQSEPAADQEQEQNNGPSKDKQYFNAFWAQMENYAEENGFDPVLFEQAVLAAIFQPIGMAQKVDEVAEVYYQGLITRMDEMIVKCREKFFWMYPGQENSWKNRNTTQAVKQQESEDDGMF